MLKVLICDDEYGICQLIQNLVRWEQLDLELIGIARDGEEGLRMIREQKPDIVITDINMPKITGLELIRSTQQLDIQVKFIPISGYAEFEYAHTAIKYGVSSYLLKPINQEELNTALQSVSEQILKDRGIALHQKQQEQDIQAYQQRIRKYTLTQLYHGGTALSASALQTLMHECCFQALGDCFQILAVAYDSDSYPLASLPGITEPHCKRLLAGMQEVCFDAEYILVDNIAYFLLNYARQKQNTIRLLMGYLLENSKNVLSDGIYILPTFGIGSIVSDVASLGDAVQSAKAAITSRVISGCGGILDGSLLNWRQDTLDSSMLKNEPDAIEMHMDIRNSDMLLQHFSALLAENESYFHQYPHLYLPFVSEWLQCFRICLQTHFHLLKEEEDILMKTQTDVLAAYQQGTVLLHCSRCITTILQSLLDRSDNSDTKILQIVKNFVQEHFSEHIELKDAAAIVFLSPSYLGILFKKKTGMNFSDYVTDVRINVAKEYLRNIELNISEIAKAVGYKDTRYFSKLFKKATGVKPVEYRKIYHSFHRE